MKNVIAVMALMAASISSAYAGVANSSITAVRGTSQSVTFGTGFTNVVEGAVGFRHLDASQPGTTSVRDESYIRGSNTNTAYGEITTTRGSFAGVIFEATRIGESHFITSSRSRTVGIATGSRTTGEIGVFTAYDVVGDSYSYEQGGYIATTGDYSLTLYGSQSVAVGSHQSAYAIYGAN